MDNREIIIKAFEEAGQPLKAGEVAEATGVDKKEVGNIIKKLKDEAIISSPKRCYYEISK
ncbi:MarR family transcriptional regulator [Vallitalea pronyensis]|uniref:MarR family transcriptional regulator n=1 Tax=Vallitalea pronyensis TaxID=1348613 RepID=A0A8J8MHU0_9FIRM|nr:MarR family transcriptional regulator [Vallitalea pronyensis]QUI21894.1 MarR family transcriptional regulator [Vallitalea pronyensis]